MPARAFKNGKIMALGEYIKDTQAEMKHVSWPTRAEAVRYTIAVIGISIATALILFLFDQLFVYLLKTFIVQ